MIVCSFLSIPPNVSTLLYQYIVPANLFIQVPSVTLWANVNAQYSLYKNGTKVGGGFTSAPISTLQLNFFDQISMQARDVFSLYATQFEDTDQVLNYMILLDQL